MYTCQSGHTDHKSKSAARMCDAARKTAENGDEVAAAAAKHPSAGKGAASVGERALARNAGVEVEGGTTAKDVVKAQGNGGAPRSGKKGDGAKEEKTTKIPHGLSEAAVRAFAKIYQRATLAEPLFRPDLTKPERRVLRGDCKAHKVIVHERVPNEDGTPKSAFYYHPDMVNKEMVAKYIEAYESEAVAGKKIGAPKATGKEVRPAEKVKEKKSSGPVADPNVSLSKLSEEEKEQVARDMADDEDTGRPAKKGGSKKGGSKAKGKQATANA